MTPIAGSSDHRHSSCSPGRCHRFKPPLVKRYLSARLSSTPALYQRIFSCELAYRSAQLAAKDGEAKKLVGCGEVGGGSQTPSAMYRMADISPFLENGFAITPCAPQKSSGILAGLAVTNTMNALDQRARIRRQTSRPFVPRASWMSTKARSGRVASSSASTSYNEAASATTL